MSTKQMIATRVQPDLYRQLREEATRRDISISKLLATALKRELSAHYELGKYKTRQVEEVNA